MSEALDYKYVGSRPIRPDGVDKVTGRANFGADENLSGMLYGKVFFFKQKTAYDFASCLVGSEMCIRDSVYTFWISSTNFM